MVGTPCCAASTTASPQPSLREGSTCTQAVAAHGVWLVSSTWPWNVTASAIPSRCDVVDEPVAATSRRRRCRGAGSGHARPQLARPRPARPRSACAAPAATAPPPVAWPRAGRTATAPAPRQGRCAPRRSARFRPRASTRSRADGSDTVTYWLRRFSRGDNVDSTNQPTRPSNRPGHRPLFAMAVVHQHHDAAAVHQPGQERQAVLGVDDDVGPHPRSGPNPEPRRRHRQQRPDVDRVPAAGAARCGRRRRLRGEAHPDSGRCAA